MSPRPIIATHWAADHSLLSSRIGDSIILDGVLHVVFEEKDTLHLVSGTNGSTPFLMGLDNDQHSVPSVLKKEIALEAFYANLAKQYPNGVALAAHAHAVDLTGIYLKRPPIYGENINNHRDQYWSEVEHFKSVAVFLFGVVMPQTLKFLPEIVERAFYKNPFEKRVQTFDSHTHAAIFAGDRITAVRHVLTSSSIREGKFALFPIESIVAE